MEALDLSGIFPTLSPDFNIDKNAPCVMLNRLGDKMAGHKNLKKIQAEIKLSLISWRPEPFIRSRNLVKHSRSSLKQNQNSKLN